MAAMLIYGKTLRKSSPPEPRNLESWNLVYNICDSRPTKFIQMMILCWPLTFLWKGQLTLICIYMGKILKSLFFNDCWRLMYYIWHRYFINLGYGNISMSGSVGDLWPCFKVTWLHFQITFALKPQGQW